jgi:hypothetical protein
MVEWYARSVMMENVSFNGAVEKDPADEAEVPIDG